MEVLLGIAIGVVGTLTIEAVVLVIVVFLTIKERTIE